MVAPLYNRTFGGRGVSGVIYDYECIVGKILGINPRTPGDYRAIFGYEREGCIRGLARYSAHWRRDIDDKSLF